MLNSTKINKALTIIAQTGIVTNNSSKINCNIYNTESKIEVDYDYTFRRDTKKGAFLETKQYWKQINNLLELVAQHKFIKKHFNIELLLVTDKTKFWIDPEDDNDGYSEYEQSIGSLLKLTIIS